jgi:hypothetical protein
VEALPMSAVLNVLMGDLLKGQGGCVWAQCVASSATEQAEQEGHHGHHHKDHEEDLGGPGSTRCDAAKTEERGNECNEKEDNGVVQHGELLNSVWGAGSLRVATPVVAMSSL